jgi:glycerophosphoryl diester phosphodiesterase
MMCKVAWACAVVGWALMVGAAEPASRAVATAFLTNGVTAHRGGASGEAPENTMAAFRRGIEAGADWIELDVHTTRDGQVVVSHDPKTGRVADVDLVIKDVTWEALQKVDVAAKFRAARGWTVEQCPPARVPLLKDVIAMVQGQGRTRVSIQPKDDSVDRAMGIVRELGALAWVGFNDGSLAKMTRVKELEPGVRVFWDRPAKFDVAKDVGIARQRGFEAVVVREDGVTPAVISAIKGAGLEMGAWTVNDPARTKELLGWGVDRIYTDHARELLGMKAKLGP